MTLTAAFVLARVVVNPISNVLQKLLARRGARPLAIVGATHGLLSLAVLPYLAAGWPSVPATFWLDMALCALLSVAGNVLLVHAVRSTDLSLLGPINSYKAVLSLLLGLLVLGEVPSTAALAGTLLILAGSAVVVGSAGQPRAHALAGLFLDRGVQFRLAALICSATEAVFLKRAVLHAGPGTTFVFWCLLGLAVAALAGRLRPAGATDSVASLRRDRPTFCLLALSAGISQLATLLAFGVLQVGPTLALFQLSTLISVGLGHRCFAEPHVGRRLIGSAIMVAGAVLIVAWS